MGSGQHLIAVKLETKTRLYHLKGVNRSYEAVIIEALNALEEKKNDLRSQPGSNETGNKNKEAL